MNKNHFCQTNAFSLLEILIYTAIVGTVTTFLGGVLVSVTKIQSRTSASVEVNQQLNFVLNNIQRLVGESSVVEIPSGTATSTLVLRMSPSSSDPTSIYLQNNTIYLKQGTGTTSPLTSDQVVVNDLKFLKTSQYPGHDSVQVDLTVSYNTQNPELSFSKTLSSAIARVSAATFDSDIIPGVDNTYDIGLGATRWQDMSLSGNLLVGGNVGVGTNAPAVGLHLGTAASSHSLSASNDMIVSGKLEVDSFIYSDKGIDIGTAVSSYGILANGNVIIKSWTIGTQVDPVLITGGATDRTVIIGPGESHNRDFGHGAQTNPTLFIHSVLSPDTNNTRWLSLKHTGTGGSAGYGLINTGSGDLILQPSGNVGIGTISPSAKLDVNGTTQMTGFKMPTGASNNYVLTSDASGVGTWKASGGGGGGGGGEGAVHGSGAANYVAKWTDSSNIGNSQIFDDGTTVSFPGYLAIGGGMGGGTGKYIELPSTVNDFIRISGEYTNPDTSNGYFVTGDNAGDGWYFQNVDCCGAGTLNYMRIARNEMYYIGGNVGIGTVAPIGRLDVQGATARTGATPTSPSFYVTGTLSTGQTGPASGNIEFRHDNQTQGIGFGYNTIYQTGMNPNQELNLLSRGTSPITLNAYPYSTGKVGIGTTNPQGRLHIASGSGPELMFDNAAEIQAKNTSGTPEGFLWPRWNDNMTYLNYGGNGFNIRNNSSVSTMFMGNGGNVGIGSTNPVAKLHVSAGDGSLAYFGPNSSWDGRLYVGASPNVSGTKIAQVISTDGNLHLDNATGKTMYLNYYQSGNIIMNNAGGNVGIGMNPSYKLDVNGQLRTTDIYLTDGVKIEGLSGRNYFRDVEGAGDLRVGAAWGMPGVYAESGAGVLGGAGGASLQNNSLFVTTGGKVGIGTTNPGLLPYIHITPIDAELRVAGDVMIDGYIAGATYGFGGLYQIDDCGVNNVFNWLTQGFSCPAGFTARQYGRVRAAESNCGASQYVCIKAFSTVSP